MICVSPLSKKVADRRLFFPCGKCAACIQRKSNDLFVRGLSEYYSSGTLAHFVTLTYSNAHLPNAPCKVHLQKFFKRLRINLKRNGNSFIVKYLAVSEYGTKRNRLHYHFILFNIPNKLTFNSKPSNLAYFLRKSWGMGFTHTSPVRSVAALTYCIKYIYKDPIKSLSSNFNPSQKNILLLSHGFGRPSNSQIQLIENKIRTLYNYFKTNNSLPTESKYYTLLVSGRNYAIPRYFRQFINPFLNDIYSALVARYIDTLPVDVTTKTYDALLSKLVRKNNR